MKLKRPPYPEVVGTAGYFFVHAGHRETAVDCAIELIRSSSKKEMAAYSGGASTSAPLAPMDEWLIESLLQGAWLREFHEWEKATKSYFEGQHDRNGSQKPNWKGKLAGMVEAASHIDRVRAQLESFGASVSSNTLAAIDSHRQLVNNAKHKDEYFVTEQDYRILIRAIADFWNELASQEQFSRRMG